MIPYLHIWNFNLPTFGLVLWLAIMAAAFVMDRSFRRARVTADALSVVAVTVMVGIIGAKLWHVIDTPSDFHYLGWSALWDSAGYAWFGGLFFGILALLFQGRWTKVGMLRMLDLAAPAAAIGQGIGRIGCFLSGDGCYGIEIKPVHLFSFTFHPWGMSFPKGLEPVFVPVFPTPLYELAAGLLIGGWLWWRGGKHKDTGAIVCEHLLNPLAVVQLILGCLLLSGVDKWLLGIPWNIKIEERIEWAFALLCGGWLLWLCRRHWGMGAIVGQYLLLSGIARFLVEFIRRNPKVLWGLSNAQLASAGAIVAGFILISWAATHRVTGPDKAAQALEKVA